MKKNQVALKESVSITLSTKCDIAIECLGVRAIESLGVRVATTGCVDEEEGCDQ